MFTDKVKIHVKGGDGGRGMVAFHTEKYITNGGPDGGDGGKGGDVILRATKDQSTLRSFRYKRKFFAPDGENGKNRKMYGRGGENLVIDVPVGTLVKDVESGKVLTDMIEDGMTVVIANGGRGGQGNIHFSNSVRQAPNFARAGIPGDEYELILELKLLADVGLVGLPNAGKSTLLSVISAAKPKIANYPFTTIDPVIGMVQYDDVSFVVADIPGLIEGAHEGAGLGMDFLRHIERTRLLVHVVDVSAEDGGDAITDFETISSELEQYDASLKDRPRIVVANKIDQASEEQISAFSEYVKNKGFELFLMSAAIADGTEPLVQTLARMVPLLARPELTIAVEEEKLYKFEEEKLFEINVVDGVYCIEGAFIRNLSDSTNFDDPDSLNYFQRMMRKRGIIDALEKKGIQEGDPVKMYDIEFEYIK
ncbi:MAG TPA: GTPase ObgE [Clostridiaceae bacterium]|jgi:GTP-binding protein|nr:GTPase ObgE [Clostridiaceae bacterium]